MLPRAEPMLGEETAVATNPEAETRRAYELGDLYDPKRICLTEKKELAAYVERLLADKLAAVRRHYSGGRVLDLCCATGEHLFGLSGQIESGTGLDFSRRYIEAAMAGIPQRAAANLTFVHGDAKAMPFATGEFALVYSFSSLYAIPDVELVIGEIGRVLQPGGAAVLDFGNRRSLNSYCLKFYTEWPQTYPITVSDMYRLLRDADLAVIEGHSYQLLPLWAGRPSWLKPLLHPVWSRMMARRLAGRMLDEWLSSMPLLRQLAFRHLLVCRKGGGRSDARQTGSR